MEQIIPRYRDLLKVKENVKENVLKMIPRLGESGDTNERQAILVSKINELMAISEIGNCYKMSVEIDKLIPQIKRISIREKRSSRFNALKLRFLGHCNRFLEIFHYVLNGLNCLNVKSPLAYEIANPPFNRGDFEVENFEDFSSDHSQQTNLLQTNLNLETALSIFVFDETSREMELLKIINTGRLVNVGIVYRGCSENILCFSSLLIE